METSAPWWGFSKEHGWVVLDRDIPSNVPGIKGELLFYRCRDSKIFFIKWELWKLPAYQSGLNYARACVGAAAEEAQNELQELTARWPEIRLDIHRQYQEIVDREEEIRRDEEKRKKKAALELKKQRAVVEELKAAG